jgi:hypothetical protein
VAIPPVAICSWRACSADLFATVWATGGDLHGYDVTAMSAYMRIAIVAETTPCWPWPVTNQVPTMPKYSLADGGLDIATTGLSAPDLH